MKIIKSKNGKTKIVLSRMEWGEIGKSAEWNKQQFSIGATPLNEDCAQVGTPNYMEDSRKECIAFINQIKRVFGNPPAGAELKISRNKHDFGDYLDVVVEFDSTDEIATEYAINLENNTVPYKVDISRHSKFVSFSGL